MIANSDGSAVGDVMEIPLNQVIKISQAPIVNCKNALPRHPQPQPQPPLPFTNSTSSSNSVIVNGNVNQNNVIQCNNDDIGNMYATVSRNRTCLMGKFGPKKVMMMGSNISNVNNSSYNSSNINSISISSSNSSSRDRATSANELQFESNSDTGLSSMGEDITQMGTLV